MTKRPPTDMGASAFKRLKALPRTPDQDFNLTLVRYGCERLLYRLSRSAHARSFMLKGVTLFVVWEGEPHRPTRDVDLLGFREDSAERLRGVFEDVCRQDVEDDGVVFDPASIDVGDILEGRTYQGNVEKLHAMAQHGMLNSRMKDIYDVQALAARVTFDGGKLAEAAGLTFEGRGRLIVAEPPAPLTSGFATDAVMLQRWAGFLRRSRIEAVDLPTAVDRLRAFLLPPWEVLARSAQFEGEWPAGGPWRVRNGR